MRHNFCLRPTNQPAPFARRSVAYCRQWDNNSGIVRPAGPASKRGFFSPII